MISQSSHQFVKDVHGHAMAISENPMIRRNDAEGIHVAVIVSDISKLRFMSLKGKFQWNNLMM